MHQLLIGFITNKASLADLKALKTPLNDGTTEEHIQLAIDLKNGAKHVQYSNDDIAYRIHFFFLYWQLLNKFKQDENIRREEITTAANLFKKIKAPNEFDLRRYGQLNYKYARFLSKKQSTSIFTLKGIYQEVSTAINTIQPPSSADHLLLAKSRYHLGLEYLEGLPSDLIAAKENFNLAIFHINQSTDDFEKYPLLQHLYYLLAYCAKGLQKSDSNITIDSIIGLLKHSRKIYKMHLNQCSRKDLNNEIMMGTFNELAEIYLARTDLKNSNEKALKYTENLRDLLNSSPNDNPIYHSKIAQLFLQLATKIPRSQEKLLTSALEHTNKIQHPTLYVSHHRYHQLLTINLALMQIEKTKMAPDRKKMILQARSAIDSLQKISNAGHSDYNNINIILNNFLSVYIPTDFEYRFFSFFNQSFSTQTAYNFKQECNRLLSQIRFDCPWDTQQQLLPLMIALLEVLLISPLTVNKYFQQREYFEETINTLKNMIHPVIEMDDKAIHLVNIQNKTNAFFTRLDASQHTLASLQYHLTLFNSQTQTANKNARLSPSSTPNKKRRIEQLSPDEDSPLPKKSRFDS